MQPLLERLELEQVQKALVHLYRQEPPQEPPLTLLAEWEWEVLARLLVSLMWERKTNSLH